MVDSMIRLFRKDAKIFSSNGLGQLSDATSCIVTEELNGPFELELEYPIIGAHYNDISIGSIIFVKSNPFDDGQAFRVYMMSKPINGIVTINAQHISYDLSGYLLDPSLTTLCTTVSAIFQTFPSASIPADNPFIFEAEETTKSADWAISVPVSIRSVLGDGDGGIIDIFGGEYTFDNYHVLWSERRGLDRGVSITYGKNLTDITNDEDGTDKFDGIYPYWYSDDEEEGGYVELDDKVIQYPASTGHRYMPVDLTEKFETIPSKADLEVAAREYLADNDIYTPKNSVSVSFEDLSTQPEYSNLGALHHVYLGDTVTVLYSSLGVDVKLRCIKTEYDAITGRYISIELGDAEPNLATTVANQTSEILSKVNSVSKPFITKVAQHASRKITGNLGGYAVLHDENGDGKPDEFLILDNPDIDSALKVWRWNEGGLGFSNTGYDGLYSTAITNDGWIVGKHIAANSIRASSMQTNSLMARQIIGTINNNDNVETVDVIRDVSSYESDNPKTYKAEAALTGLKKYKLNNTSQTYLFNYGAEYQHTEAVDIDALNIFQIQNDCKLTIGNCRPGTIIHSFDGDPIIREPVSPYRSFQAETTFTVSRVRGTEDGSGSVIFSDNFTVNYYYEGTGTPTHEHKWVSWSGTPLTPEANEGRMFITITPNIDMRPGHAYRFYRGNGSEYSNPLPLAAAYVCLDESSPQIIPLLNDDSKDTWALRDGGGVLWYEFTAPNRPGYFKFLYQSDLDEGYNKMLENSYWYDLDPEWTTEFSVHGGDAYEITGAYLSATFKPVGSDEEEPITVSSDGQFIPYESGILIFKSELEYSMNVNLLKVSEDWTQPSHSFHVGYRQVSPTLFANHKYRVVGDYSSLIFKEIEFEEETEIVLDERHEFVTEVDGILTAYVDSSTSITLYLADSTLQAIATTPYVDSTTGIFYPLEGWHQLIIPDYSIRYVHSDHSEEALTIDYRGIFIPLRDGTLEIQQCPGYLSVQDVYATEQSALTISADNLNLISYSTTEETQSAISMGLDSLSLSVSSNGKMSVLQLTKDGVAIGSTGKIDLNGLVSFNDLSGNSSTVINGDYIKTGTINTSAVEIGDRYGGFTTGTGNDGRTDTIGAKMYGSDENFYFIATNGGVRMQAGSGGQSFYCSPGMIYASTTITEGSDRNLKEDIDYDYSRYSDLFDRLRPATFRYKGVVGDRPHFGFIAQDVEEAASLSGLEYDECGLYSISNGTYGLRYSEFAALNVFKIQQLQNRCSELEDRIAELEKKLSEVANK